MENGYPEEDEDLDSGLDASWLAGMGEYSATGGGSQPLHSPQLRGALEADDRFNDAETLEELYRDSLVRLTGDDHSSFDEGEGWEEGPLHIVEASR